MSIRIAVIGLGYVGLPLALAFARKFEGCVGYDINEAKVRALKAGEDVNREGLDDELKKTSLLITSDEKALKNCNFFVVGVPTPVDGNNNPDLSPLEGASKVVGRNLTRGSVVVFESTVYPGVTEEFCGPVLEAASGLVRSKDFTLGYSPERMNPGDKEHSVDKIVKVVAGEDAATLDLVASVYGAVITAGVHRAPSIKVAEAAKVIENTQRDLNIALMNELSMIFERLGISTRDVLEAASTKWNFLRFSPGLVGGHCIGVDPYYLTTKAQQLGYHPQVILAGRRINDGMGAYLAQRLVKSLITAGGQVREARVGILGITFKENVTDVRNSRIPDIVKELDQFGIAPLIHDPYAEAELVRHEYNLTLSELEDFKRLDALVLGVSHRYYLEKPAQEIFGMLRPGGVFVDVKSVMPRSKVPKDIHYWSL